MTEVLISDHVSLTVLCFGIKFSYNRLFSKEDLLVESLEVESPANMLLAEYFNSNL